MQITRRIPSRRAQKLAASLFGLFVSGLPGPGRYFRLIPNGKAE
jgi:hypothetical protein